MKQFQFRNSLVIVVLVFLAGCQYSPDPTLDYIRKVTKVEMPDHLTTISEFDNLEWITGGKYLIKEKDIKAFLIKNGFHPIDKHTRFQSLFNTFSKEYPIPWSDPLSLKYLTGYREGNSWVFTVNENTGELWVEVQYPD